LPVSDWTPGLADVGAILRARTKDVVGNELGTFTVDTRPTDVEVSALISQGVADVAMATGSELPASVWNDAKSVAAFATALRVELSYFPEQINTGRSPYQQLKQLYDDMLKRLLTAVESSGGEVPASGAPMRPVYNFPVPPRHPLLRGAYYP